MNCTLQDAANIAKLLESIVTPFGLHVAVAGGCVTKHGPRKDIDIWFYQRDPIFILGGFNRIKLVDQLVRALSHRIEFVGMNYSSSNDTLLYPGRCVVRSIIDGLRVDLFLDNIPCEADNCRVGINFSESGIHIDTFKELG